MQININVCDNCPLRLYNTKRHNFPGVGDMYSNVCILVPSVDYDAYKAKDFEQSEHVKIIKSIISPTGELDWYIAPYVRCYNMGNTISIDIVNRCYEHFKEIQSNFTDILVCGEVVNYIGFILRNVVGSAVRLKSGVRLYFNYSPLVKYADSDKFEVFKENLIKFRNAVTYKDASQFKWMRYEDF